MKNQATPLERVSRRQFIDATAATGTLLALTPKLGAAGTKPKEVRTFFFNLAHENYQSATYYLVAGGNRYALAPASPDRHLVNSSRFLRSLPSGAITHVAERVELPANSVTLNYVMKSPNTDTGEWQMSAIYLVPPKSAYAKAHAMIVEDLPPGAALPHSARRKKYGLPAAQSLRDLLEEQDLIDATQFATTLTNLHPEMLSMEPVSAAYIQTKHIQPLPAVNTLREVLEALQPAAPQAQPGFDNTNSWATLMPYTDDDGVTPLKSTKGNTKGLILYDAKWSQTAQSFVGSAVAPALRTVKNDTKLGADVTSGPSEICCGTQLAGTIWHRHDGTTSIDQTPGALNAISLDNVNYTATNATPNFNGYSMALSQSVSGGQANITLNFKNWYLRWLGLYIQFYDGDSDNNIVPKSKLPSGISVAPEFDTANSELYLGTLTPEFTIFGIPVQASANSVTFAFPTSVATRAKVLASGLGYGSHTFQETETIGIVMTSVFNLSLPALLIAFGIGAQVDVCIKTVVVPFAIAVVTEILNSVGGGTGSQFLAIFWRAIVKGLTNPSGPLKSFLEAFGGFLVEAEVTSAVEDAIPIVGAVLQAVGALGALAEIDETSIEVLLSPWTYAYSIVGTHDLSITLLPDTKDPAGFPAAAATYKVTATFDDGAPHTQTLNMPGSGTKTLPPVVFKGVPLGGNVVISVAFYTEDGTQVGHQQATTQNGPDANPTITIIEDPLPIKPGVVYQHKQKTSIDANGDHYWICAPAPTATAGNLVCEAAPGAFCAFRSISINSQLGYIGYAWRSYSTQGCSPGSGQLDQMANIPIVNGSGDNAQIGYASLGCGLPTGALLAYDPASRADSNFYLDSSSNLLRQISLNPPQFFDPKSQKPEAWGKFNMDPDDLLLHPSGAVVSINSNASRIETLKIPAAALPDSDAATDLLANVHGGLGTRPGLMNNPTVATITAEGTLLVLESGNNRIHALDISGNPVRHFSQQPDPYFLNLAATGGANTTYVDIAVEFSGFIYVLSYNFSGNGFIYRLDIYAHDQTGTNPVTTTMNMNAAGLVVDYFRNVYTLNYEALKNANGSVRDITEPSISQWIPATPPPCDTQITGLHRFANTGRVAQTRAPSRLLRRRDLLRGLERGVFSPFRPAS